VSPKAPASSVPEPGEIVAERYRVERVVVAAPPRRRFLAIDRTTEQRVEIVELPNEAAVAWAGAMTIEHPVLSTLLATLARHGASYGVFEHASGRSLDELVAAGHRFDVPGATRATLALIDAVARLRRAGIVHGGIDGAAVVFRGSEPDTVALAYRGSLPEGSPFRPPERSARESAEPADDLWSLTAVYFVMLTGRAPPQAGVYAEQDLRAQGIEDPVLRGIVAQGLAGDPGRRSERLASLSHPLSVWLAAREADLATSGLRSRPSGARSLRPPSRDDPDAPSIEVRASPPSEPPSEAAPSIEVRESSPPEPESEIEREQQAWDRREPVSAPSTSAPPALESIRPTAESSRRAWLGVGAVAALALAALFALRGRESAPAAPPAPSPERMEPAPAPQPSIAAPAPAPIAKPAPSIVAHRIATENTATCVVRHLPEGSFASVPDMEFLCTTHDPRKGDHLVRAALVNASNGLAVTPAMRLWSGLGWYGLAGYATLRAACCPDAPPIELPTPGEGCDPMGPILDQLGKQAIVGTDVDASIAKFHATVSCEVEQRRAAAFWQKRRPGGAEPTLFRGLVQSVSKPRATP
jgi:hypothetical protein